ncbi:MAG TPA: hypothetical protein VFQ30_02490 [Ktedonobacteraceae bacterium]|nr:hypothetical protein [Ktedonobacteraceae bacterium]
MRQGGSEGTKTLDPAPIQFMLHRAGLLVPLRNLIQGVFGEHALHP